MDESDLIAGIFVGIGIIIFLVVLSLPVTGTIAGMSFELPIIGWVAFAAFAVIALYLFFKHRA